jgi:hypothetical protein
MRKLLRWNGAIESWVWSEALVVKCGRGKESLVKKEKMGGELWCEGEEE